MSSLLFHFINSIWLKINFFLLIFCLFPRQKCWLWVCVHAIHEKNGKFESIEVNRIHKKIALGKFYWQYERKLMRLWYCLLMITSYQQLCKYTPHFSFIQHPNRSAKERKSVWNNGSMFNTLNCCAAKRRHKSTYTRTLAYTFSGMYWRVKS